MLKLEQINKIKIEEIKVEEPIFQSHPDIFKWFFQVILIIGNRGMGKTTISLNLLKLQKPYIDKLYILSPNANTDKKIVEIIKDFNYELYDELTEEIIDHIKDDIDRRIKLYQDGERLYKLIKKKKKTLTEEEEEFLEDLDIEDIEEMMTLYKKGRPPTSCLWLSDMVGHKLLHDRNGPLVKMIIKNRHRFLTALIETQNMKSISPPIRKCASVFMIAPTMDYNYRKQIYEEVEGVIPTLELFHEILDKVAETPHQFLTIFNDGKTKQITINLDKKISF